MTERDDRDLLAAGYALGSLTPEECAEYEAYLAEDARARREAQEFGAIAAALADEVAEDAPPPALKARLMAQIATLPQEKPAASEPVASSPVHPVAPVVEDPAEPARPVAPPVGAAERRARQRWYRRPGILAAAAAAAVVLFAGGTALGAALTSGGQGQTQQASALAQIMTAPDAQRATQKVSGGGVATLVWSDSLGKSAIAVTDLSAAPAGKTYQLWYISGSTATSAGLLDAHGSAWQVLDGRMTAGDAVGVTVEPSGGSKAPTSKPVLVIAS